MPGKILLVAIESNNYPGCGISLFDYGREMHYPRTGILLASCIETWGESYELQPVLLFLDGAIRNYLACSSGENDQSDIFEKILLNTLKEHDPLMVGIVAPYSHVANAAYRAAKIIRRINPEIPVITGGPHNSFIAPQLLVGEKPLFDAVILGPGEAKLKHIIENFNEPEKRFNFPGIATPEKPCVMSEEAMLNECGPIPKLNLNLFNPREYGFSVAMIMGGRGCHNACRYCLEQAYWRRSRIPFYNAINEMRHEIMELKRLGIFVGGCADSTFNTRHPGFQVFCEEVVALSPNPHKFVIQLNIDMIEKTACRFFAAAGGGVVQVGLESGVSGILAGMRKKKHRVESIKKRLALAKESGIRTLGYFLFGYPGETRDSLKHTLEFIQELCTENYLDYIEPFVFMPYPGLPMYNEPEKFGIIPRKNAWENWDKWERQGLPPYDLTGLSGAEIFAAWQDSKLLGHQGY